MYKFLSKRFKHELDIALPILKRGVSEYLLLKKFKQRSKFGQSQTLGIPVEFDCFISSDKGVFSLIDGRLTQVFNAWTMGIAISGSKIYFSCSGRSERSSTLILSGDLEAFLQEGKPYNLRELYRLPILSSGHRIHQVCVAGDKLWAANTARNTLLQLDRKTGEVIQEIAPLVDRFGWPILYENHHINSVSVCGDVVLFVAYRAGKHSMLGVYGDNRVRGYLYDKIGVHDVYISGTDLFFSDTFGNNLPDQGGCLVKNGQPFDAGFFDQPPGMIVRGIAGYGKQILIGHSHKGERSKRFDGQGSLLLAQAGKITDVVEVPFAQVYDIIQITGETFDVPPATHSFADVCQLLEIYLGKSTYEVEVTKELNVVKRKK